MAKGDPKRVQNSIDYNFDSADNYLKDITQRTNDFYNPALQNYNYSTGVNLNDYDSVMNSYRQFLGTQQPQGQMQQGGQSQQATGNPMEEFYSMFPGETLSPQMLDAAEADLNAKGWEVIRNAEGRAGKVRKDGKMYDVIEGAGYGKNKRQFNDVTMGDGSSGPGQNFDFGALGPALAGYAEFAQTGGFSPQDIQNIRGRSNAPIKSIYQNAQDELNRSKALAGGRMTNYGAAAAKLAREASYAAGDQSLNTEGMISQLRNQGRQFGIGGQGQLGYGLRGQGLTGLSGQTSLLGTTPGLTNMFGNQVLQSGAQGIDIGQLRNQLATNRVSAQLGKSQMPDRIDTTKKIIGLGSDVAKTAGPFFL